MDELKREDQIEKIQSLINKKDVSRRDFFGTLGKIAVLSQVVVLGAGSFLASCVAFEDKKGTSGILKYCDTGGNFSCTEPDSYSCGGEGGSFTCGPQGYPTGNESFTCAAPGSNQAFHCSDITEGGFGCDAGAFTCGGVTDPPSGTGFHLGGMGG